MQIEDLLKILQEIESTFDVEAFFYKDIKFWPLLRSMLIDDADQDSISPRDVNVLNKLKWLGKSFFEQFYDINNRLSKSESSYYVLTMSNSRGLHSNQKYIDNYISPLAEWTKEKIHIDELAPFGEYRTPRHEKTRYIQKENYIYLLVASLLASFKKESNSPWIPLWEKIKLYLSKKGYETKVSTKMIRSRVIQLHLMSIYFERQLKTIKPKLVVVMCYYTTTSYALMYASKKLGIPSIDLQHGIQFPYHHAYSSFEHVPTNGWNILPNYFWNWREEDTQNINSWGKDKHIGLEGGIIWHQYLKESGAAKEFEKIKRINNKDKPNILVTLQPILDNEDFYESIREAISSPVGQNFFWLIRLHPGMLNQLEQHKALFEYDNCDVETSTNMPLPILLDNTSLHVTRNSSVVIEAALYNIRSVIDAHCDLYEQYRETKLAISSPQDLQKIISNEENMLPKNKTKLTNSKLFWDSLTTKILS